MLPDSKALTSVLRENPVVSFHGGRRGMLALPAVFAALALIVAACSRSPTTGELTVTSSADLCGSDGKCVFLPAADAAVQVYKDGRVAPWRRARTNDAGRLKMRVPPGTYTARVALPDLRWETAESAAVSVSAGGAAEITVMFPRRTVSTASP